MKKKDIPLKFKADLKLDINTFFNQKQEKLKHRFSYKIRDFIVNNLPKYNPQDIEIDWSKQLGCGTYGTVWEASMKGTKYAVKMIYLEKSFCDDPLLHTEIQREIYVSAKMKDCSGFLKIFGYFIDEKFLGIVMELLSSDIVSKMSCFDGEKKFGVVHKIVKAVKILHEKKILHRDIKANNILMKGDEPIIADFGMAKFKEMKKSPGSFKHTQRSNGSFKNVQRSSLRKNNSFMCQRFNSIPSPYSPGGDIGLSSYQPAEVIKSSTYTLKSDIYSLGMALIELLTSRKPFEKLNECECVEVLDKGEYPSELELIKGKTWKKLIKEMLDLDYLKRPSCKAILSFLNDNKKIMIKELELDIKDDDSEEEEEKD